MEDVHGWVSRNTDQFPLPTTTPTPTLATSLVLLEYALETSG